MTETSINNTHEIIIDAIRDRKGHAISIVDLSNIPGASASTFVIAEGSSNTQVAAIADRIEERLLKDLALKPFNTDGFKNSEWIVLDYGDTWIHIFLHDARVRYNLEGLWSDAPITEIPDLD